MISKPDCFGVHADDDIRREIIKATYQNAINRGIKTFILLMEALCLVKMIVMLAHQIVCIQTILVIAEWLA